MLDIQENLSFLAKAHRYRNQSLQMEAKRRLSISIQVKLKNIPVMTKVERAELCFALVIVDLNEQMDRFNDTSCTTFRHDEVEV